MSILSEEQISDLVNLRHELHRKPEISGEEAQTAQRIAKELTALGADRIWTSLGGHGVAAEFSGSEEGPNGSSTLRVGWAADPRNLGSCL